MCSRRPRHDLSALFFWGCQFNFLFFTISVIRFREDRINPSGIFCVFFLANCAKQRTKTHMKYKLENTVSYRSWCECRAGPGQAYLWLLVFVMPLSALHHMLAGRVLGAGCSSSHRHASVSWKKKKGKSTSRQTFLSSGAALVCCFRGASYVKPVLTAGSAAFSRTICLAFSEKGAAQLP